MTIEEIRERLEPHTIYNEVQHDEETYFTVGSKQDVVISNSFLSSINPDEDGSDYKADLFFEKNEEKTLSKSMEKGKLIHKYIKDPASFIIAPGSRPSDAICTIIEDAYRQMKDAIVPSTSLEVITSAVIRAARSHNYQPKWGELALAKGLIHTSTEDYFEFLKSATENTIITTEEVKESLEGMQSSLANSGFVDLILNRQDVIKEIPIFYKMKFLVGFKPTELWFKILVDMIDVEGEEPYFLDFKSTSYAPQTYMGYKRIGWALADSRYEVTPIAGQMIHDGQFQLMRTYRQMGLYWNILSKILDTGVKNRILAIESKKPYRNIMYVVEPEWNIGGWQEAVTITKENVVPYIRRIQSKEPIF